MTDDVVAGALRELCRPLTHIDLYAVDPGALAVLREVAPIAWAEGRSGAWYSEGWATRSFAHGRGDAEALFAVIDAAGPPPEGRRAVFLGSQTTFHRTQALVAGCAGRGIVTVFFFDHWKNYGEHFIGPDGRATLPDVIVVPDDYARDQVRLALAAAGVGAGDLEPRLRVIGPVAVLASARRITSVSENERALLRHDLEAPPDRPLVLVLLDPPETDPAAAPLGYDYRSALRTMAARLRGDTRRPRAVIRPHPRQSMAEVAAELGSWDALGIDHRLTRDHEVDIMIAAADEIWGMTTIALVAALKAGKPIRSFQPGRSAAGRRASNPWLEPHLATADPAAEERL